MPRGITLKFATISCDRCGGVRLMSQPCPECGQQPRPHETQPDLERRRRLLAEFKSAPPSDRVALDTSFEDTVAEVPALIKNVTKALARVAQTSRSATELTVAFAELDSRVSYWSQRQPRPNTNRGRSLGRSLHLLRGGLAVFAEALGQPTMLDAQAKETEGQRLIDAATEEIGTLQEVGESELLLAAPGGLGPVGVSARAAAGGDEALASLDEQLQRIAGRDEVARPLGLGLNLHLFRQLMLALLDLEECLSVAAAAEENMGDLSPVCEDPRWQARHGVVTAQFSSAAFNLSRIDDSNDLEAVAAALQLVMQCRDGVIRHCLATLLATDAGEFHDLVRQGTGHVIKMAAARYPQLRLNDNLSQDLRHAAAHYDYDVVDDVFVTHAHGTEVRLPIDEFLDHVLGYLQTSVSLLVALLSATAVQGLELEIPRHTPERDLLAAMSILVGFIGFSEASVVRNGHTLMIRGTGDVSQLSTAAAGIATMTPEGVDWIRGMTTDSDGATHSWEAPAAAFREYLTRAPALSETDDLLALARVMSAVSIDSAPAWNEDMWAGVAMLVFNQTERWTIRERVLRLREVRDLARKNDRPAVVETLTAILQAVRRAPPQEEPSAAAFVRRTRA